MKEYYRIIKQLWEFIKPVWRILLIVAIAQLVSGFVLVFNPKYGYVFVDFWFGAAVSSFPSFVVGSLWQLYVDKEIIKDNLLAVIFIGFSSIGVTLMSLIMPLEDFRF